MCVTNTTHRRVQAVTLAPNQLQGLVHGGGGGIMGLPQQASTSSASSSCFVPSSSASSSSSPASAGSALSQRLLGAFAGAAHSSSAPGAVFPSCHSLGLDFSSYASPSDCEGSHNPNTSAVNRPKRRRKPQKPGKTAKLNDRHFVVHNYHDHANDPVAPPSVSDSSCCSGSASTSGQHALLDDHSHTSYHSEEHPSHPQDATAAARRRGGVAVAFPLKLHAVLEQVEIDGYASVVSWSPHGRCFVIHKPKQFVDEVMPKYFRQSKLTSFQRQLNLYGFARLTRGPDAGGYYHELFLRRREHLCARMIRTKVKGTKFKAASSPDSEPDFYALPPVDLSSTSGASTATTSAAAHASAITPPHSDAESSDAEDQQHQQHRLHLDQRPTNHFPPAYQPSYAANAPVPLLYSAAPVAVSSTSTSSYAATAAATPLEYYGNFLFHSNLVNNHNINSNNSHYNNHHVTTTNTSSDQILDDAVDELFLHELGATGDNVDDQLTDDFVSDWMCDPTSTGMDDDDDDDAQLGFMLERLLED